MVKKFQNKADSSTPLKGWAFSAKIFVNSYPYDTGRSFFVRDRNQLLIYNEN